VLEVVAAPARRALEVVRSAVGADRVQLFGDRLHVHVPEAAAGAAITARLEAAGCPAISTRRIVPSLEDVFIDRLAQADRSGS
jgi:hypothetical protein